MSIPKPLLPPCSAPSPRRPVVRATLACRYCATTFAMEFAAEDELEDCTWMGGIPTSIASVKRERQSSVRCWLFWSTLVTEEIREPIACPNCGRTSCAITKREPIAKEPATTRIVAITHVPPCLCTKRGAAVCPRHPEGPPWHYTVPQWPFGSHWTGFRSPDNKARADCEPPKRGI